MTQIYGKFPFSHYLTLKMRCRGLLKGIKGLEGANHPIKMGRGQTPEQVWISKKV